MVLPEEVDSESDNEEEMYSVSSTSQASGRLSCPPAKADAENEMRKKIINKEETNVRLVRCVLIVAGIACAVAVGAAINIFAHQNEQDSFELEYNSFVASIFSQVQLDIQFNFALMQQMSASVTASAIMTGSEFPYLTQSNFEISGGYVVGMGGIMSVAFAPLVEAEKESEWVDYSIVNQGWIEESKRLAEIHPGHRDPLHGTIQDHEHDRRLQYETVTPYIWRWEDGRQVPETSLQGKVLAPLWQVTPEVASAVNSNLLSDERVLDLYTTMIATNQSLLSAATEIGDLFDFLFDPDEKVSKLNPHAFLMEPVYSAFVESPELVGLLLGVTSFENTLDNVVQEGANGIVCVISDSCGNDMTYELNGPKSTFLANADLHDKRFDRFMHSVQLESYETVVEGMCVHKLKVYPSAAFRATYGTNKPAVYTCVITLAFVVTAVLLIIYDTMITRRHGKLMRSAIRTSNLVASMFPENVRDRLMEEGLRDAGKTSVFDETGDLFSSGEGFKTRPIADFFPEVTIMFADISGFTAWASTREPCQVFLLLETVYSAFDALAKRRGVFKIETIGDCYVAVCGVPIAHKDHAVIMARFARDIHSKMHVLTRELEVALGPDTADLAFRIGLHSGPVTGGVLRGDNARFQLFGDAMNTASRIESTGARNRVHISKQTADLLITAGKTHWIKRRDEIIVAKGLGELETFWLVLGKERSEGATSMTSDALSVHSDEKPEANLTCSISPQKMARLIDWNIDVLLRLLKQIAAARGEPSSKPHAEHVAQSSSTIGKTVLDEVREIIALPKFDADAAEKQDDVDDIEIDEKVIDQLSSYVSSIAALYQDNPFHNFEHASHVTMSVNKLLSRIVAPPDIGCDDEGNIHALTLHDHTYGITSDPLTQFACVFSAIIHDVDHQGVPNTQLVAEKTDIAAFYKGRSIAEQNSVDLAWELLMVEDYADFRAAIYDDKDEKGRFRQLVVNSVMATDIMDKELKNDRNARWSKAFTEDSGGEEESPTDMVNRKATIVIEHLIQASDVSHTMQHWHIYRKWNERLFEEMYKSYAEGRSATDPSENWYKGELGFFDFYIIPLAKKLNECGVFGVSSDEYLNYAMKNRGEWERKGQEVVEQMKAQVTGAAQE